jgi:hypothetical protein
MRRLRKNIRVTSLALYPILSLILISQILGLSVYAQDKQSETLDEKIASTDENGNTTKPCALKGIYQYMCISLKKDMAQRECFQRYFPNNSALHGQQLRAKIVGFTHCTFKSELQYYKDIRYPDLEIIKHQQAERDQLAQKLATSSINEEKFMTLSKWLTDKQKDELSAYEKRNHFISPDELRP